MMTGMSKRMYVPSTSRIHFESLSPLSTTLFMHQTLGANVLMEYTVDRQPRAVPVLVMMLSDSGSSTEKTRNKLQGRAKSGSSMTRPVQHK